MQVLAHDDVAGAAQMLVLPRDDAVERHFGKPQRTEEAKSVIAAHGTGGIVTRLCRLRAGSATG